MALVENSGVVSGSGSITSSPSPLALTITGVYSAPNLTATLSSGLHPAITLTGTVTGSTMTGALNGSGFTGAAITFAKQ